MSAVDLLPCPFCGGEAKLSSRAASDGGFIAFAVCYCGAFSARAHHYGMGETAELAEAAAMTAWNRRAPVSAGKVKALEEVGLFPVVLSAHQIARGVNRESIDPLQGYVAKEDCALYAERILSALQPGDGWQGKADAMAAAIEAEADARALYLATMPDRGGQNGPKGQRRAALEAAQTAAVMAARAYRAPPASLPQGEETR